MPDVIELLELDDKTVYQKKYIYDAKTNKFSEVVIKKLLTIEALNEFYKITEIIREPPIEYKPVITSL
jgi:hypothetical protein